MDLRKELILAGEEYVVTSNYRMINETSQGGLFPRQGMNEHIIRNN